MIFLILPLRWLLIRLAYTPVAPVTSPLLHQSFEMDTKGNRRTERQKTTWFFIVYDLTNHVTTTIE